MTGSKSGDGGVEQPMNLSDTVKSYAIPHRVTGLLGFVVPGRLIPSRVLRIR